MPDETTPAPLPAPPAVPAPLPVRRPNTRALRRLREPIRPQNIAKRPIVWCWDCRLADENHPGETCERHNAVWCKTCSSTVSRAHNHQDSVGHPEVTDRLLDADLKWNWRPMAFDDRGLPQLDDDGGMWIYLMVGGVERPAYGKPGEGGAVELISNSLTNGSLRFGVALNQRARTDLHAPDIDPNSKVCPGCGMCSDPDANFCSDCGHELPTAGTGDKVCSDCGTPCGAGARFCPGCGHPIELEYARPDWIARVNSMLASKRGAHGPDRLAELSEILGRVVTDVAEISPAEARDAVRILSSGPDHKQPAPAAADPAPTEPPPPAKPEPTAPAAPEPSSPPRAASTARTSKRKPPAPPARPVPPPAAAEVVPGPGDGLVRTIDSLLSSRGVAERDTIERMRIISAALRRPVTSYDELSHTDALTLIHQLGSGEASVDPPAAATAGGGQESDRAVFDTICAQIAQAITDEDAGHIKTEIGKALTAGTITKAEGGELSERLTRRGRQVGLAGAS